MIIIGDGNVVKKGLFKIAKKTYDGKEIIKRFWHKNKKQLTYSIIGIIVVGIGIASYFIVDYINQPAAKFDVITNVYAEKKAGLIVKPDSTFIIETKKTDLETVKKHVYLSNNIDYDIKQISATEYRLIPQTKLADNNIFTVESIDNETPTYKWAFQTKRELSVTSAYPQYSASVDSVIELEFSMNNVEDLSDYFTITDDIKGEWTHNNYTWIFSPTQAFSEGKKYEVTIKKGLKAGANELKADYSFSFETRSSTVEQDPEIYPLSYAIDGVSTFTPQEKPTIVTNEWDVNYESQCVGAYTITMYQYPSQAAYLKALNNSDLGANVADLTKIGSYSGNATNCIYTYGEFLTPGYYLGYLETGGEKGYKLIQVSELGVYIAQTKNDVLVWVTEGSEKKANVKVALGSSQTTTNEQGLAKLTNIKYTKDANNYIQIGNQAGSELFTTLEDRDNGDTSYNDNSFIYTDRPFYKKTDTIKIWGYIPLNDYYGKIMKDVTIEADDGTSKTTTLNDDGTFSTEMKITDYSYSDLTITLVYNNQEINWAYVTVYDYQSQIYNYEITTDRKAYNDGDEITTQVKVAHITGVPVEGKRVKIAYNGTTYTAKTDANSQATFKFEAVGSDDEYYYSPSNGEDVCVYNGESEDYNDYRSCANFDVYYRDIFFDSEQVANDNGYSFKVEAYKVDIDKINDYYMTAGGDWYYNARRSDLIGEGYNAVAQYAVIEDTTQRVVTGKYYDKYSQTYVNNYEYINSEKTVASGEITIKEGIGEINNLIYEEVETEDLWIDYTIEFYLNDQQGRPMTTESWLDDYDYSEYGYGESYEYFTNSYNCHYYFGADKTEYSIGEDVKLTIYDKYGNPVENTGEVLLFTYKDNIITEQIFTDSNIAYTFSEDTYPGNEVGGAFFINGHLFKIGNQYIDFKKEDRKVNIQLTPDKIEYGPGDTVTLKIATTDVNDKPLAANVNISVVDEAVFKMADITDEESILDTIYYDKYYSYYDYASYYDYNKLVAEPGGYGGVGGGYGYYPRSDFKDTVYFDSVTTDATGNATITFKLPDNITSFRITAHAANKDAYVGYTFVNIISAMNFFIESTPPQKIKYTDDVVVNAAAFGIVGEVNYTFTIKEINQSQTVNTSSGGYANANFGKLSMGEYTLNIEATSGEQKDALEYKFTVGSYVQEIPIRTTKDINQAITIKPTGNPIKLEIYNRQTQTYVNYLNALTEVYSVRLDTQLAYYVAQDLRIKFYGGEPRLYVNKLDPYDSSSSYYDIVYDNYNNRNGLALLDNESDDPLFTALVAKYAAQYINYGYYDSFANNILVDGNSDAYEVYCAYLVKSALNQPILEELAYLEDDERNLRENLVYALSYAFLGDYDSAKTIYQKALQEQKDDDYSTNEEVLIALLATMIDKDQVIAKLDKLIDQELSNEYIRFAIISFLENNAPNITEEKTVKVTYGDTKKDIKVKGLNVETLTINKEDLKSLSLSSTSNDLVVSYYYNSDISEIADEAIKNDVKISLKEATEKYSDATLKITFPHATESGLIKIALPNALRFNQELFTSKKVYLRENQLDSLTLYYYDPDSEVTSINIPLIVTNSGNYVLEPVVVYIDDIYHISESLEFTVK